MGKRFAIVIGVVAAGVTALGAQTAAADSVHHGTTQIHHLTTVTLGLSDTAYFFGGVSGGPDRCERGRTVKLLYTPWGDPVPTGSEDKSDDKGHWAVYWGFLPKAGNYQASVTRKAYRRHGRKHICDPGKSLIYVWPP